MKMIFRKGRKSYGGRLRRISVYDIRSNAEEWWVPWLKLCCYALVVWWWVSELLPAAIQAVRSGY